MNEIRNHGISEIEKVYDAASGAMQYGKISYDGDIVIWDNSSWREIYDYIDIHDEQPYVFKFVWSFFVERLFHFW